MTQEEKRLLIDLSWRYAVLIGVTAGEGMFEDEVVANDKEQWGQLIKKSPSGLPAFYETDALTFMREMSGQPEADCLLVIRQQWNEELCTDCSGLLQPLKDVGIIDGSNHLMVLKCELCDAEEIRTLECLISSCPWCACGK